MRVCHMTSVHRPEDVRIFVKECVSLAKAGHEVFLVEQGDSYEKNGVHIIGVGEIGKTRRDRIITGAKKVYERALAVDADVYHIHDPELLFYGTKMKRLGKKVVFDSHEDIPAQILDKPWIPKPLRKPISVIYGAYAKRILKRLDGAAAATPYIADAIRTCCKNVVTVNNYPKLDDIVFQERPFSERDRIVCYAGGIDDTRGEQIMKEAMKGVSGELLIAGDHRIEEKGNVRYLGRLDRRQVNELYGKSVAGLCLLLPIKNYFYSQPTKIYEYMAAGLPFICSDFPAWRTVAEQSGAGICVDPNDTDGLKRAVSDLLNDTEKAQAMGSRGREYVLTRCNWANEEKALLSLYDHLQEQDRR